MAHGVVRGGEQRWSGAVEGPTAEAVGSPKGFVLARQTDELGDGVLSRDELSE